MQTEEELPTIDQIISTLQKVKSKHGGSINVGIAEFNTLQNKTFSVSNLTVQVMKTSENKEEYVVVLAY